MIVIEPESEAWVGDDDLGGKVILVGSVTNSPFMSPIAVANVDEICDFVGLQLGLFSDDEWADEF